MNVENLRTGYIRIYRSLERNPVWTQHPAEYLKVWMACLLRANYKPSVWYTTQGEVTVPRGAFVCSAEKLALNINVTCSTLRRALKALQVQRMIEVKSTKMWTMISVCNYDGYNFPMDHTDGQPEDDRRTSGGEATDSRRTRDGQPTTSKESNTSNTGKKVNEQEHDAPQNGAHGIGGKVRSTLVAWKQAKFEEFWAVVWQKTARGKAEIAFGKAVRTEADADLIVTAAKEQGRSILEHAAMHQHSVLHPATWLSQGRYLDEPPAKQETQAERLLRMARERDAQREAGIQ